MKNINETIFAYLTQKQAKSLNKPILIVCPDMISADRIEKAIQFFDDSIERLKLPDWETLPYDHFSPHHDIVSERIQTLYKLQQLKTGIVIVPTSTLCQRLAPIEFISQQTFRVKVKDSLNLDHLKTQFIKQGYRRNEQVFEHGEFAIRGSIIDVFPMGSDHPFRIELFDDEVETIRYFDTDTQRSLESIDAIELMPAHEFPFDESGITHFRKAWRSQFEGNPLNCPIYQDVSEGIAPSGLEYYQPLFFDEMTNLIDYLPEDTHVIYTEHPEVSLKTYLEEVDFRYEQLSHDIQKPILKPEALYLKVDEIFHHLKKLNRIEIEAIKQLPEIALDSKLKNPTRALDDYLKEQTKPVLFTAESLGRREHLIDLLNHYKPKQVEHWQDCSGGYALGLSQLQQAAELDELIIIPEAALLGQKTRQRQTQSNKAFDPETRLRNLAELKTGAHVVHIDHGVAIYQGLKILEIDNRKTEFITLEYAENNKLYVPVTNLEAVSLYRGSDNPALHTLGQDKWQKTKDKAAKRIKDVAAELLEVYAKREAEKGFAYTLPELEYAQFSNEFPFEETPDQARAIEDVIKDMESSQPMDRLVCGDVGFGKTEVAMRAAFVAVQNQRQVAILVPTTLLAQQHFESFSDRFANWPIQVEVLSRFRSAKQTTEVLNKLSQGKVDIIIGTHKLLQRDIDFKNLGLLILDEEHRFGVKQKEKLKSFKASVDILTLTATPIPRTLNMAFSGMRDLSIISTPPARRLSIKTFVHKTNRGIIAEAIRREILRGGQVFFLHNDVATIENKAEELREWLPEARVEVGHGQMRERELERVMSDFYHRRFHVLVCSTIIETGIDIPTANTIIINRADKFGLAQLHQLRGRVGRSHHQAYAYLLITDRLTKEAVARLEAISQMEDLGSGFMLANQDLEIRGAGELLGEEQSGQIQAIGFNLFHDLLERTVKALKSGKTPQLEKEKSFEIDLKTTAIIPDDYIGDIQLRLEFYKRLASCNSEEALKDLQIEMIDRFGLMPDVLKHLLAIHDLRLKAQALGIKRIDMNDKAGQIEFSDQPNINPATIIKLIQMQPDRYQLAGQDKLKFKLVGVDSNDKIEVILRLLKKLNA